MNVVLVRGLVKLICHLITPENPIPIQQETVYLCSLPRSIIPHQIEISGSCDLETDLKTLLPLNVYI